MDFDVDVREQQGRTVVTVRGELDAHTAPALREVIDPLSQTPGIALVADLGEVGFVDSTGLGVLVSTLKHVREGGGSLDVVATNPRVLKVLAITGLDVIIPLHESLDGALAGH